MTAAILQRLANIRREEVAPALVAGLFFFCVLTALMVVRPAREALGMQRGIEALRWLFIGTVIVTLLVNPLFGWMVSRFRRLAFINATYLFFAFGLLAFYALLVLAPASIGERTGQVFYVWFSVFNLFATMLFWALMADRFSLEQAKRLFGAIAVGGTLGAICGPWLLRGARDPPVTSSSPGLKARSVSSAPMARPSLTSLFEPWLLRMGRPTSGAEAVLSRIRSRKRNMKRC